MRSRTKGTARTAEGQRWRAIRRQLFGWPPPTRDEIASAFGLSVTSIDRYEAQGAPEWYLLALEGLAARMKQEGQARA